MNEEEKEAIKILKQEPDFSLSYYKRERAIDIVLDLIEKQQKEIEELKRKSNKRLYRLYKRVFETKIKRGRANER